MPTTAAPAAMLALLVVLERYRAGADKTLRPVLMRWKDSASRSASLRTL